MNDLSTAKRKHLESNLIRAAAELMDYVGKDSLLAQVYDDMYFAAGTLPEIQAMTREVVRASRPITNANDNCV